MRTARVEPVTRPILRPSGLVPKSQTHGVRASTGEALAKSARTLTFYVTSSRARGRFPSPTRRSWVRLPESPAVARGLRRPPLRPR